MFWSKYERSPARGFQQDVFFFHKWRFLHKNPQDFDENLTICRCRALGRQKEKKELC